MLSVDVSESCDTDPGCVCSVFGTVIKWGAALNDVRDVYCKELEQETSDCISYDILQHVCPVIWQRRWSKNISSRYIPWWHYDMLPPVFDDFLNDSLKVVFVLNISLLRHSSLRKDIWKLNFLASQWQITAAFVNSFREFSDCPQKDSLKFGLVTWRN